MRRLFFTLTFLFLAVLLPAQTIAVTTESLTQGDIIDVTIYGGTPGQDGTVEITGGTGQEDSVPFTYNDEGHAVVRITMPSTWDEITFSIDPDSEDEDVNRTLLPKTGGE